MDAQEVGSGTLWRLRESSKRTTRSFNLAPSGRRALRGRKKWPIGNPVVAKFNWKSNSNSEAKLRLESWSHNYLCKVLLDSLKVERA